MLKLGVEKTSIRVDLATASEVRNWFRSIGVSPTREEQVLLHQRSMLIQELGNIEEELNVIRDKDNPFVKAIHNDYDWDYDE